MVMKKEKHGFFERLSDHLTDVLSEQVPIEAEAVPTAVKTCVSRVVEEFGGEQIYLPKDSGAFMAARNAAIRQEFDGRNKRELARKYGLCPRRIEEILAARPPKPSKRDTDNEQRTRKES